MPVLPGYPNAAFYGGALATGPHGERASYIMLRRNSASYECLVPQGVREGDEIMLDTVDGLTLCVCVPVGVGPGDVITVDHEEGDLAASDRGAPSTTHDMEVVVPEGCGAGDLITVTTSWGAMFEVNVPDGCGPGTAFTLEVPTEGQSGCVEPAREQLIEDDDEGEEGEPAGSEHRYRVGQRVRVLRSSGQYSSGVVECSFDGVFETLYSVRLDMGLTKPAVAEEEMFAENDADDPNFAEHLWAALASQMEADMQDAACGMMETD